MTTLGVPLPVPSPRPAEVADRLEAAARALGLRTRDTEDWRLGHVRDSLAMLSVALRNAAHTGPQSHEAGLRTAFPEEYGEDGRPPDRLIDQRAQLDVVGFLSVGDMVLADIAALVLGREGLPLGRFAWSNYMQLIDELATHEPAHPEVRPARTLDLTLREARNRLVAHRLETQGGLFTHDRDHTLTPLMVNPTGMPDGYQRLREANARLAVPRQLPTDYEYAAWADLVEWIILRAGDLDAPGRDLVRAAFRMGEYALPPMADMAEAVLRLVTVAAEHAIQTAE